MLGYRLRRWPTLIHEYNREYISSEDFLNTNVLNLKLYIRHVQKDWCTEMSIVSNTQHPFFP